jgi:hypothetical protein
LLFRLIVHALAILHLGPGIAFAVLAFGCDGANPLLGHSACEGSNLTLFFTITAAGWVVLSVVSWWMLRRRAKGTAGNA